MPDPSTAAHTIRFHETDDAADPGFGLTAAEVAERYVASSYFPPAGPLFESVVTFLSAEVGRWEPPIPSPVEEEITATIVAIWRALDNADAAGA